MISFKKLLAAAVLIPAAALAFVPEGSQMPRRADRMPSGPQAAGSCNITVKLVYGDSITPLVIGALTANNNLTHQTGVPGMKTVNLQVAPGTYEVWARFCKYHPELSPTQQTDLYNPFYYIIKENVSVTESGTEVVLDASTATNFISFEPVTPQGEKYRYYVLRQGPDGAFLDGNNANIYNEAIGMNLSHSEYGSLIAPVVLGAHQTETGGSASRSCDFYINNVSDKYSFSQTRLALDTGNNLYLVMLSSKGIPSGPVSNTAESFKVFEEKFNLSPRYYELPRDIYNSGITIDTYIDDVYLLKLHHESRDIFPKAYIARNANMSGDTNPRFCMFPHVFEMDKVLGGQTTRKVMGDIMTDATKTGITYTHQTHTFFTFGEEKKIGMPGNNVPVTKMVMHKVKSGDVYKVLYRPEFWGRFGELRESDADKLEASVSYNGNVVHTGFSDLDSWAATWAADSHTPGKMTARFVNRNVKIGLDNDSIFGTNVVEVAYTEGSNDMCAPTVQHLQFSNAEGKITDHVGNGEAITIKIAAGDANGNGIRFSYTDAKEIKVEYAPNGVNRFAVIPVNVMANASSTQVWTVYGATLSNIMPSNNGCYDLRITLKDQAGNTSVQTLSPAFYMGETQSVETAVADKGSAVMEGNTLIVNGYGIDPSVQIYNVAGAMLLNAKGAYIDCSQLAAGLYIVRVNGKDAYKILKH